MRLDQGENLGQLVKPRRWRNFALLDHGATFLLVAVAVKSPILHYYSGEAAASFEGRSAGLYFVLWRILSVVGEMWWSCRVFLAPKG